MLATMSQNSGNALLIGILVIVGAFLFQVCLLRWIFRVDEIVKLLKEIRDKKSGTRDS